MWRTCIREPPWSTDKQNIQLDVTNKLTNQWNAWPAYRMTGQPTNHPTHTPTHSINQPTKLQPTINIHTSKQPTNQMARELHFVEIETLTNTTWAVGHISNRTQNNQLAKNNFISNNWSCYFRTITFQLNKC